MQNSPFPPLMNWGQDTRNRISRMFFCEADKALSNWFGYLICCFARLFFMGCFGEAAFPLHCHASGHCSLHRPSRGLGFSFGVLVFRMPGTLWLHS